MLIGIGENPFELRQMIICVEAVELVDVTRCSAESVFSILYAIYYIFSIKYPVDHRDFFYFIDAVLVGLQMSHWQIRISVQKLVKELEQYCS